MKRYVLGKQDIHQGNLILVNGKYLIQKKVEEEELESFSDQIKDVLIHKEANQWLQKALKEINAGKEIIPVSGYRSLEEQKEIFSNSMIENGEEFTLKYVAYPNASEHQTGFAIDLGLNEGKIDFIRPAFPHTGICEKFRNIAIKYGFIERYMEEKKAITKISAEEWHFRYVGYPHSEIMKQNQFCLEEYHDFLKKYQKNKLRYKNYEIYYLPLENETLELELSDTEYISGNNIDGFIITRKI